MFFFTTYNFFKFCGSFDISFLSTKILYKFLKRVLKLNLMKIINVR